jgi:hypothetical protein
LINCKNAYTCLPLSATFQRKEEGRARGKLEAGSKQQERRRRRRVEDRRERRK